MLLLLWACVPVDSGARWGEALAPSGPCHEFNFADGVDGTDNTELHAAFACLNRQGTVQPLARLDAALDLPTRSGTVGGSAVAGLSALAAHDGLSLAGLLRTAVFVVEDPTAALETARFFLEVAYAVAVPELGLGVSVNSTASLSSGVLWPALETGSALAAATLDADLDPLAPVATALRSSDAPRWAWTLALLSEASDPGLSALAAEWPAIVATIIDQTADSTNDRDPGATGNSLRDGVVTLTGGDALVDLVAAASPILSDDHTRDALARWVEDEEDAGRWERLDGGLAYLAGVDRQGGHLDNGEDSALVGLVRLLHDTNQPVECSVDLLVTDLHVDLGNLAVVILEALAKIDPDTASGSVDVLGDALGYPLTTAILDLVADSGACPVLDAELVEDLASLDRLSDPSAEALLRALLGLLAATDEHIPAVADTATALHDHDLVDPIEELLYDVGSTSASRSLLAAIPGLLDPDLRQATEAFPAGVRPVDIDALCDVLLVFADADTWARLQPLVGTMMERDSTWEAVANSERLLNRADTATSQLLTRLRDLVDADPELLVLTTTAGVLEDAAVVRPLAEVLENEGVRSALTATELTNPGPVPWLAQLYVGGTLPILFDTLALFAPLLGGDDA